MAAAGRRRQPSIRDAMTTQGATSIVAAASLTTSSAATTERTEPPDVPPNTPVLRHWERGRSRDHNRIDCSGTGCIHVQQIVRNEGSGAAVAVYRTLQPPLRLGPTRQLISGGGSSRTSTATLRSSTYRLGTEDWNGDIPNQRSQYPILRSQMHLGLDCETVDNNSWPASGELVSDCLWPKVSSSGATGRPSMPHSMQLAVPKTHREIAVPEHLGEIIRKKLHGHNLHNDLDDHG